MKISLQKHEFHFSPYWVIAHSIEIIALYKLEGLSVEHVPPPRDACSTRTCRGPNRCLKYYAGTGLYRFWPNLSMVKNHLKKLNNYLFQIWIRIFTKMESILPCQTPDVSTEFHPNPSSNFWDIVLYYRFWPFLSMVKNRLKYSSIRILIFTKI